MAMVSFINAKISMQLVSGQWTTGAAIERTERMIILRIMAEILAIQCSKKHPLRRCTGGDLSTDVPGISATLVRQRVQQSRDGLDPRLVSMLCNDIAIKSIADPEILEKLLSQVSPQHASDTSQGLYKAHVPMRETERRRWLSPLCRMPLPVSV